MSEWIKLLHGIRLIGYSNAGKALRNSIYRDNVDRKFLSHAQSGVEVSPGKIISVDEMPSGVLVQFQDTASL